MGAALSEITIDDKGRAPTLFAFDLEAGLPAVKI
jgi:hypothetical protein